MEWSPEKQLKPTYILLKEIDTSSTSWPVGFLHTCEQSFSLQLCLISTYFWFSPLSDFLRSSWVTFFLDFHQGQVLFQQSVLLDWPEGSRTSNWSWADSNSCVDRSMSPAGQKVMCWTGLRVNSSFASWFTLPKLFIWESEKGVLFSLEKTAERIIVNKLKGLVDDTIRAASHWPYSYRFSSFMPMISASLKLRSSCSINNIPRLSGLPTMWPQALGNLPAFFHQWCTPNCPYFQ